MSKRYRDTDIWDEDWFLALTLDEKMLWLWICDRCNHAGIWRVNTKAFEMKTGCKIDRAKFLANVNGDGKERIRELDGGRWIVLGFIGFQYQTGVLVTRNAAHRGALSCLAAHGVTPESIGYTVDTSNGTAKAADAQPRPAQTYGEAGPVGKHHAVAVTLTEEYRQLHAGWFPSAHPTPEIVARWRTACEAMLDAGRTVEQIRQVWMAVQRDEWWRDKITGLDILREKWNDGRLDGILNVAAQPKYDADAFQRVKEGKLK